MDGNGIVTFVDLQPVLLVQNVRGWIEDGSQANSFKSIFYYARLITAPHKKAAVMSLELELEPELTS